MLNWYHYIEKLVKISEEIKTTELKLTMLKGKYDQKVHARADFEIKLKQREEEEKKRKAQELE